jgi:type I restriction enzyme S subunit
MKQGWEIKTIGDVCKVIAGQSPEGKFYNDNGNGLPFYQGKKEYGEKYIGEPTTWTTKVTKEAEENDILMSVRAPVGPINFATQKICIGRGLAAIRPTKLIDKEFLYNFLLKHESEIIGNTGAVFNSINKAQIEAIEIPLPPLSEQQRIVAILDEAFASIAKAKANAEQNLKNAKELFESYLQGVFENEGEGWEEKYLGEVCDFENGDRGKNYPNKSHRVEIGFPFINAGHLKNNKIDFSEMDYISEERLNLLGNGKIKPNDILFCLRGSLGKVVNVGNLKKGAIASSLVILRVRKELDNDFLLYFLNSNLTTNQIVDFGNGAAQPNLSAGSLKKFIIPLPKSIKEQQIIVQKLDALSDETKKLETIYQQKINDLEELKKSILQKAFSGELKTEKVLV